jgi:regulator of protease activity HflC (stomatin/prohibitin superfamily)
VARLERKPAERVAAAGLIVQLVAGGLGFLFWKLSDAATAWVLGWQGVIGALVWLTSIMYLRNSRLAEEEQAEWDRLQAERAAGGAKGQLFEEDEIQAFSSRNRLRILEKYIVPIMGLVVALCLAAVVGATLFGGIIPESKVIAGDKQALLSMAGCFGMLFVLFLIAMYASGMSRQEEWRPLRACASYMMFTALVAFLVVVALGIGYFKFSRPDWIIAYVMLGLLALVSLEILLNLVLDIYRPRVEGVETRTAYDSRLLALLAQPGSILKTVSTTLDYQFGFKVSQTWFYRFLEQAIAPLLLFQILTLYLLSSLVIIGPEQRAVWERMGRYKDVITEPGLYFKMPWPFDRVYRFTAGEIKSISLGHAADDDELPERILWTQQHYKTEYSVLLAVHETLPTIDATPVDLLAATTTVRYQIEDVKKWYYGCSDPEKLLAAICEREQIKYLAGADLFAIMGVQRSQAATDLQELMQAAADQSDIGVEIVGVGVEGMHPPVEEEVPQAFHELVEAITQKEVDILNAETLAIQVESEARAQAERAILRARGYYASRVKITEAEAQRFLVQNEAYTVGEEVFRMREYLGALEDALRGARKYVIGVNSLDREIIRLNLEDKATMDISNITKFHTGATSAIMSQQNSQNK